MPGKQLRLRDIEEKVSADPNFWQNPKLSAPVLQEKKLLEDLLCDVKEVEQLQQDFSAAMELAEESAEFVEEAESLLTRLTPRLERLETKCLLGAEEDQAAALLSINAGAGGTESCDWAEMLLRMYSRFAASLGWEVTIHDIQAGDEAGIKSASIEISGDYAYGLLKAESGVHRLVRVSPFDSNARRHTSFAAVFVSAVIDDSIEVEINPADLRIDTYRASGAGGQHVNRTDSAVRITHAPSGVVVQCQSQRSQHQNKDTAMKLLRTKLHEIELEKRRQAQDSLEKDKSEIGFGSQIRSYVLHPYKLVKDHRTNVETSSPNTVLDGELMPFIKAYLATNRK